MRRGLTRWPALPASKIAGSFFAAGVRLHFGPFLIIDTGLGFGLHILRLLGCLDRALVLGTATGQGGKTSNTETKRND